MRIAITGGSGSLGTALMRRLTAEGAERIVAFSRDEQRRARMAKEFGWHPGVRIYAGDVRDADRLPDLFRDCEVVIHAAARKVVTAHSDEPREMLQTNVLGTANVIAAARTAGVRKLLLISSDKAVRAENVYGVSKAMAEHLVVGENGRTFPAGLRMAAIRYGNVLASTGSVLPIWAALAARKEPFPISDRRMTRFWVTLPQAVDFVLKAVADLRGGEVFVPQIPAAPLTRLAEALTVDATVRAPVRALAEHRGSDVFVPDAADVVAAPTYDDVGIRPGGEKLHEELLSAAEARRARRRNGFFVVPPYQNDQMWDAAPWLGVPVPEDFTYRSDTCDWQLDVGELRALVAAALAEAR